MSSSPPPDSGDELAGDYVTQPTQPLHATRSPFFPAPAVGDTQPTLLLTPRPDRVIRPSHIQVARSSPAAGRAVSPIASQFQSQSQHPYLSAMAPPGTYTLAPQPVPRPAIVDLTSDDPPVEPDSEEELWTGSNIAPSKLETQSRAMRVEETPEKPSFDMSAFAYNGSISRKRPIDQYRPGGPQQKKLRQIGPSRAMPVDFSDDEMRIEDLDLDSQNKVRRLQAVFPNKSVQECYNALIKCKRHFDDAASYLLELSEDHQPIDLSKSSPEPIIQPKKTAQRVLNAPTKSLHQKYSKSYQAPAVSPEKPKKKGRLQRGRRNRSPSPLSSPPRPHKNDVLPAEEDEAISIPSDTDTEAAESVEGDFDQGNLLTFFNTCTVEAMIDLSGHKEDNVRFVLAQRPFKNLAAVEKFHLDSRTQTKGTKARKPKSTTGENLVEAAKRMWSAYETIDQVVKACETRGRPMVTAMARWGIDVFGGATEGEVAVISLDHTSDSGSNRDSGFHSPRSSPGSDSEGENLQKVAGRGSFGKQKLLKKPSNMNADIELKDYQVVGLNWLDLLWKNSISGILADDMGLGKTCQVIAFLSHLKESGAPGPHLIIVPGSTLENWAREFEHFSKDMNIELYYGPQTERRERQFDILERIDQGEIDAVVTTYDLAYKPEDNKFLRRCKPQMCIFDEGHVLRNSTTARYKSLMKINARCRLLLTGTPLQNSLQELASILAFLMPEIFSNEEVQEGIATVFKHKAKVTESDTHGTLLSTQRINRARSMLTPFVLRRKKAQVLKHLPKKTCRVEYCDLTETQKKLYEEQLEQQRQVLRDRAAGIQSKEQTNVMMKLRQAAIHPLLFRERYGDNTIRKMSKACLKAEEFQNSDPDIIFEELQLYQDYQCHQLATKYPRALSKFQLKDQEWMDSGKVVKLVELLKKFKENGDRTLVFSQFTSVMDILQWVLDDLEMSYFRLDGQTPIAERQDMLDEFYQDESIPVFMLSTKSGGAGINLACANKVIIFDSSFNPQDDIQAENRAHRVGQTREVEVVRLVTRGTVEEQIHALGVSKLELDKMVAGEEGAQSKKQTGGLSAEEVGLEAVEDMMMAQLEGTDVKDQFLDGLKKAGLDMSAA